MWEWRRERTALQPKVLWLRSFLSSFCPGSKPLIVLISKVMLQKVSASDVRILRDSVLGGFGVRVQGTDGDSRLTSLRASRL